MCAQSQILYLYNFILYIYIIKVIEFSFLFEIWIASNFITMIFCFSLKGEEILKKYFLSLVYFNKCWDYSACGKRHHRVQIQYKSYLKKNMILLKQRDGFSCDRIRVWEIHLINTHTYVRTHTRVYLCESEKMKIDFNFSIILDDEDSSEKQLFRFFVLELNE